VSEKLKERRILIVSFAISLFIEGLVKYKEMLDEPFAVEFATAFIAEKKSLV